MTSWYGGPIYEEPSRFGRALVGACAALVLVLAVWVLGWSVASGQLTRRSSATRHTPPESNLANVLAKETARSPADRTPPAPSRAALTVPKPAIAAAFAAPAEVTPPPFRAVAPWPVSAEEPVKPVERTPVADAEKSVPETDGRTGAVESE